MQIVTTRINLIRVTVGRTIHLPRLSVTLRVGYLLVLLMALFVMLVACEPSIQIQVHNQTDKPLQIFIGDTFVANGSPGKVVKFETWAIAPYYQIVAKDMEGSVVYTINFTSENISGKKTYRVIIPATASTE